VRVIRQRDSVFVPGLQRQENWDDYTGQPYVDYSTSTMMPGRNSCPGCGTAVPVGQASCPSCSAESGGSVADKVEPKNA